MIFAHKTGIIFRLKTRIDFHWFLDLSRLDVQRLDGLISHCSE